jgi:hypothetical protein
LYKYTFIFTLFTPFSAVLSGAVSRAFFCLRLVYARLLLVYVFLVFGLFLGAVSGWLVVVYAWGVGAIFKVILFGPLDGLSDLPPVCCLLSAGSLGCRGAVFSIVLRSLSLVGGLKLRSFWGCTCTHQACSTLSEPMALAYHKPGSWSWRWKQRPSIIVGGNTMTLADHKSLYMPQSSRAKTTSRA